ncbi:hypothetical protein GUITHDRAFT_153301 [Guillardia theta CCMP2712]|uniref:Uncharacterized protein n=2 Tax=Guillardia theta TaxID=55529 RepID=L1J409_GUITC|nr:hypothetical protein GUITHDRAFT_153301 [Guillardia theta CCMP2712]EKX43251.1 hypothetical protein GUITHDRAFT_153301 [Guillardia theta CCMP2712]|eukprot:XP_005830231.1 hypothetical protein GUITHDRAFT_153301 [Guillardia theta CCMP2712]
MVVVRLCQEGATGGAARCPLRSTDEIGEGTLRHAFRHNGDDVRLCVSETHENELEWIKDRDTQLLMDGLMAMETADDVRLLHKFISQSKDVSPTLDSIPNLASPPSASKGKKSATSSMLRDYVKRKVHDRLVSKGMVSKRKEAQDAASSSSSSSDSSRRHNLKKALYRKIENRIQTMRAEGPRLVMKQVGGDGSGR